MGLILSAWWICVSNRDEKINHAKDWISLKTPKANPKKSKTQNILLDGCLQNFVSIFYY